MNSHFIGESMVPVFHTPPPISKKPHCPNGFIWGDEAFHVQTILEEWKDYQRRGRMRSNMRPANQAKAAKRGSWGVGRFYFRVRVHNGRCFEFYYDRSPKDSDDRYGAWFLTRELFYE